MTKTYDTKCYELANAFLEDEPGLFSDANADELAQLIQLMIENHIEWKRDNYDGAPYCSAGHKTKASCDCGPIADSE